MKDTLSCFYCNYVYRSSRKMLHIFPHWLSIWGKGSGGGGMREGRAGCCTCLLPWGFWRNDYKVMRLGEWRICFYKGGFSNGKNGVCMSWSLSHQLCGGGIYFWKRVSRALLRQGGRVLPQRPSMFSYCLTIQIKLRIGHQKSISIRGRQWGANGGFIIACSQDKRVNQIQSLHGKQ